MAEITVKFNEIIGKIKPMHAVNNGPVDGGRFGGNVDLFKKAGIPYARNHDASFSRMYGAEHTVDVAYVFPDFNADENDPASYDFFYTDKYVKDCEKAGTHMFYRLGHRIEHEEKKYGTFPPKDFKKWARICEHIIRHYTEGWADGFRFKMEYWEIWNEFDCLGPNNTRLCWQGTDEQFYEFFEIVAKYLKKKFPKLKIGGPAFCSYDEKEGFLKYMKAHKVPMDFYSYHCYPNEPKTMVDLAERQQKYLTKYGYGKVEKILDEWNYLYGSWWGEDMGLTYQTIQSIKGAAFVTACQIAAQNTHIDMLMYYDARPQNSFNGLFGRSPVQILKPYWSFVTFNELYKLSNQCKAESDNKNVYTLAAAKGDKKAVLISYYDNTDKLKAKKIKVNLESVKAGSLAEVYIVDANNDYKKAVSFVTGGRKAELYLDMEPNTIAQILIK
ncbi:MAG: hypothetical protein J5844_05150 [Clostridia bacterium]|nr:hypothetical protein [Clostridia bacterium]